MDKIILNGLDINSKEDIFKTLKEQIDSEEFIGNNLDALYDVLSTTYKSMVIVIKNFNMIVDKLGDYANDLKELLTDVVSENDNVKCLIYNHNNM